MTLILVKIISHLEKIPYKKLLLLLLVLLFVRQIIFVISQIVNERFVLQNFIVAQMRVSLNERCESVK